MSRTIAAAAILHLIVLAIPAHAHFPWVQIDSKAGDNGAVLVHFEHSPKPGDGAYLDPFIERGTLWLSTPDAKKPAVLSTDEVKKDGNRWMQADLPVASPRSADFYVKWGVYRYGKKDTLLHYYARNIDARTAADINQLSAAKQLDLHLQPRYQEGKVTLRLVWQGKPVAGSKVYVSGIKQPLTTDDKGEVQFDVEKPRLYYIRTNIQQPDGGEFNGKKFEQTHRHTTLTMRLPPAK